MEQAWRVAFAHFLKEQKAVEAGNARHYVNWVGRWLASGGSDGETRAPATVSRFIDELGRTEKPENVRQAEEAIRLYGFFQARAEDHGETARGGSAADWDALAAELTRIARLRRLSLRTERSYLGWLARFGTFTRRPSPSALTRRHVETFVSHLAVEAKVSASTQNQAFSALHFLYRHVLGQDLGGMSSTVRAPEKRRLPVVLSQPEVRAVLDLLPKSLTR